MPELPEVETVVRGLRRSLPGRRILSVRIEKSDFIDDPALVERELPGSRIVDVVRHGKFFLLRLARNGAAQPDGSLLVHLGMTGLLTPRDPREPAPRHTHVFMPLDDGRELRYTDARRFGRMAYIPESSLAGLLSPFGLEPTEMSFAEFREKFCTRRAMVKALLLNQQVLRGVGNIYADESLWRARIHPMRNAATLNDAQARALHRSIQRVLAAAIKLGGSSIANFRNVDGDFGEFQLRHRAYGREGKPCPRCGCTIRRMVIATRSSFFCPRCQPAPRGRK